MDKNDSIFSILKVLMNLLEQIQKRQKVQVPAFLKIKSDYSVCGLVKNINLSFKSKKN